MKTEIAAIILAAGKGKRINSKGVNKVAYFFLDKPMVSYGVELFEDAASRIVVVIGAYAQSVKGVLLDKKNILFAYQKKRLGTAHAVAVGVAALKKYSPTLVLVGMGDHMMFYKKQTIREFVKLHQSEKAVFSVITTVVESPTGYGRIIREKNGTVSGVVEEKDATPDQKKIKEINAGLYCFDFTFLLKNLKKIKKSPVTKEYYIPELIPIALSQGKKVTAYKVPYSEVGIGVNLQEEFVQSQKLYKSFLRP